MGVALVLVLLLASLGEVVVGTFRIFTKNPGLTGIESSRLRGVAWVLCGTDVRWDGSESRYSLGNRIGGSVQIVVGLLSASLLIGVLVG